MSGKLKNIFLNPIKEKTKEAVGWLLLVAGLFLFLFFISFGFGTDVWYDEIFSLEFAKLPYGDIVAATAADVHPPFYYWYLKTIQGLCHFLCPMMHPFIAAKIASMLPILLIFIYALTMVRRRYGMTVAGSFLFLVITMPQLSNYFVEIRMYSLALFMITAFFLHTMEIIYEHHLKDYIFIFIYGILTAYTQYYACIAIVVLYLSLLVYEVIQKNQKGRNACLACIGLSVLAYIPWLPSFFGQITAVNQNYWIQPLSFRSIFGCFKYVFLPVSGDGKINYVIAVSMIAVYILLFFFFIKKKTEKEKVFLVFVAALVPVMVALSGFLFSALGRPIFVYRYLISGLGIFWFSLAFLLAERWKKRWGILLLIPFVLAAKFNGTGFYYEESKKVTEMEATEQLLKNLPKDAVVLTNFNHVQAVVAAYLEQEILLYAVEPESLIQKMMPNCGYIRAVEESDELLQLIKDEDVYFFGSFNWREDLVKQWEAQGIKVTEEGSYLLERYWFNLYHLE